MSKKEKASSGGNKGGGKPGGKAAGKAGKASKKKKGGGPAVIDPAPPARLQSVYQSDVVPQMMKRFEYSSVMQVPRLSKIVVNMGVGDAVANIKALDSAVDELGTITGQKASIRRAKKSIANFKLREGQPIGCMVTLRGVRMWEFLDRLTTVAIPRIRDFRGLPTKSFDGRGNYTFGIKEQVVFPEIHYDRVEKIRGMDVTLVTTAKSDEEGMELLKSLKWPFRRR